MLNIAIIDDDHHQRIDNKKRIKNIDCAIEFCVFDHAYHSDLKKQNHYDIYIFSISKLNEQQFKIIKEIRKINCPAIFILIIDQKFVFEQFFDLQPFLFIRKNQFDRDFKVIVSLIARRYKKEFITLHFVENGRKKDIKIHLITYIEAYSHRVVIHQIKEKSIVVTKNLRDILEDVEKYGIVQIHKSYLVNLSYIKMVKWNQVLITNNVILPVGRKYKDLLFQQYYKSKQ